MEQQYGSLALAIMKQKYLWDGESWEQLAERVAGNVLWAIGVDNKHPIMLAVTKAIAERKFLPAGRYLWAAGRDIHMVQNCFALEVEDTREAWAKLLHDSCLALTMGGGVGVDYSKLRGRGAPIKRTGGVASGPVAAMAMLNEVGRHIQQGGSRRSALLASLSWDHPDIAEFIHTKNWDENVRKMKALDFNYPAPLDGTNISVRINDDFMRRYAENDRHAVAIYNEVCHQMCRTGEPGLLIALNGCSDWYLTNPCSELRAREPDSVCNLGSINMARVESLEEFTQLIEIASIFLYAGTFYSDVPYPKIAEVRNRNRQIGLGLMGIHEWLLKRGYHYGDTPDELKAWMQIYAQNIEFVRPWAAKMNAAIPAKGRAIAPTGTVSILAETTSGIEPIFCVAYKRRYLKGSTWLHQFVVDPTAKRLIETGLSENAIEDAYSISLENRLSFQAFIQSYTDMAISSTINMPRWGSEYNNSETVGSFGKLLMQYIPQLKGVTVYPDASRSGQPLTPVKYSTAVKQAGIELTEGSVDVCDLTKGGSCGS